MISRPLYFLHGVSALLVALLLLTGCQQAPLRSNAMVAVDIACPDYAKVARQTVATMSAQGYVNEESPGSQVQSYSVTSHHSPASRVLTFVRGGQDRIEIIAQPLPHGWRLYAMVEPGGYDTCFPRRKVQTLLEQVRDLCEKNPRGTTN